MTQNLSNIPQALIGFWKVVDGDYPLVNEYRSDGMLIQHVGNQTSEPTPFRVKENFLVSLLEQPDGTTSEEQEQFELSGDRLTFIDEDGSKRLFQRVNAEQLSGAQKPWWKFW